MSNRDHKKRAGADGLFKTADALPPKIFTDASVISQQGQAAIKRSGPTARQAERARLRLIKRLNLVADKTIKARMKKCRAHDSKSPAPCWQNLCPVCGRLLGRWIAWTAPVALRKVLKAASKSKGCAQWTDFSIITITPRMRFDRDEFQSAPELVHRVIDNLHGALKAAGISIAIGAINLNAYYDSSTNYNLSYGLQLRAIILTSEILMQKPKHAIATSVGIDPHKSSKPVIVKMIRNNDLSPMLDLVRTKLQAMSIAPTYRGIYKLRVRHVSRARMMRSELLAPLSPVFTDLGLEGRLFLHGARTKTDKLGRAVIRPLPEALKAHNDVMQQFHDYFADLGP